MALGRAQRLARVAGKLQQAIALGLAGVFGVIARKITVVNRFDFAAIVFRNIAAVADPLLAQAWQALRDIALVIRVAPRPAAIIDAHGSVRFGLPVVSLGVAQLDF